jgi:hypothetical protein
MFFSRPEAQLVDLEIDYAKGSNTNPSLSLTLYILRASS